MQLLRAFGLVLGAIALVAASRTPSAYEGHAQGYVNDGKQLYPVTLYGIARDWDKQCRKGKGEVCMQLAEAFSTGLGDLEIEPRGAIGYWLLACDAGVASGCAMAAQAIESGTTNYPPNPALAMETAGKGCALGDSTACATTALHYYRGDVVPRDRAKATALWEAGCGKRDEEACRMQASALYFDGGSAATKAEGVRLFKAGCDRKQGWGCSYYAKALAEGDGIAQSDAGARAAGSTGCFEASGDTVLACAVYARYAATSASPDTVGDASMLLSKACLARIARACDDAGLLGQRNAPGSKIVEWEIASFFRDGCDMGFASACGHLGDLYINGNDNIAVDAPRAIALWDKACKLGHQPSCKTVSLADASIVARARKLRPAIDPAATADEQLLQAANFAESGRGSEAFDAVARLAEEGNANAEWLLGGWLYYGYPGVVDTPDRKNGFILIENAAVQGHIEAAKWAALAYWDGIGTEVDKDRALGLIRIASRYGDPAAQAMQRSMEAEPIREANARRAKEMEEAAERYKNDFWANYYAMHSNQSTDYLNGPYTPPRSSSWDSTRNFQDESNWNQFISHMEGTTTACPEINPYC